LMLIIPTILSKPLRLGMYFLVLIRLMLG